MPGGTPLGGGADTPWLRNLRARCARVIPIVVVVDGINIGRGQFTVGNGYTVWWEALAGQIVLWTPILVYEALSRRGSRSTRTPARPES
jgi:hypothetical protein